MDKLLFQKELQDEIKRLNEIIEEEKLEKLAMFHDERNENIRKKNREIMQTLSSVIEKDSINTDAYAIVINAFLKGNILRVSKEVINHLEHSKNSFLNSYYRLDQEIKEALFLRLKEKIISKPLTWSDTIINKINLNNEYLLKNTELSEEEKIELMNCFNNILLSYLKGYIFKNEVYHYTIEGLQSLLYIFSKLDPKNFYDFQLFRYPEGLIHEEHLNEAKKIIVNWFYDVGWSTKVNLEEVIGKFIENDDYKNARRFLHYHDYLFEVDIYNKNESILISMLYDQFKEILNQPDCLKKSNQLNDIKNELNHYNLHEF